MRCADVLSLLVDIEAGEAPPEGEWWPLKELGLAVQQAPGGDALELEQRRAALRELLARRSELARVAPGASAPGALPPGASPSGAPAAGADSTRLAGLDADIRHARLAVLELAERAPGRAGVELTFRGRDLVGELATRPRHHDREVSEFLADMTRLRTKLTDRAQLAAALLAQVSPDRQEVDEAHLRAMVIGLAVVPKAAASVLAALLNPPLGVPPAILPALVESVLLDPTPTSIEACVAFSSGLPGPTREDALWATMVLLPLSPASQQRAVVELPGLVQLTGSTLAAALLYRASSSEERAQWTNALDAVRARGGSVEQAPLAAAFLLIAPGSVADAVSRFGELYTGISRLVSEPALAVPTAMLTMLDLPSPELLDDLRLASSAVQTAGLSLGPVENVSLGIKLLLHVALARQPGAEGNTPGPELAVALPVPRPLPSAMQAVSAFAAATVYPRRVIYRPTHGNSGYG